MDKKILSIFLILIIFTSIIIAYSHLNQSPTDKQYDSPTDNFDEDEIGNEIDKIFIEEDGEIEIGEML